MTTPTIAIQIDTCVVQRTQGSLSGVYVAATDVNTTKNASLAAGVLTLTLGYVPVHVRLINLTTRIEREWFTGMAANTTIDSDAAGTMSLNVTSAITVTGRTGVGGASGGGGTADTAAGGIVAIVAAGLFTDNDAVVWIIEG